MNAVKIKKLLTDFKAVRGKLILKVRSNMHYNQKQKDIAVYNKSLELGLNTIQATILANRTNDIDNIEKYISPRFKDIMDYNNLQDIDIATDKVIEHVNKNNHIVLATDCDQDGIGACASIYFFLTEILRYKNVSYEMTEREYGNGLNDTVTKRILDNKSNNNTKLVIIADQGSSSGDNIAKLMEDGIEVIVTDHHTLSPDNAPYKYTAFVNPQRPECKYDKRISGCAVIYMLCLSIANKLNKNIETDEMYYILSIAALTTISDSMQLSSITNRAMVRIGLNFINSKKNKNWDRLAAVGDELVDYKTLGFTVAPLINSASRMGNSIIGLKPFIEKEDKDIREAIGEASKLNRERKALQNELFLSCRDLQLVETKQKYTIVHVIQKGLGIQGIISSMFSNSEFKPSMIFYRDSKKNTLQGSGRSARGINLLEILRDIERRYPEDVIKCGGHDKAAGFTIKESFLDTFKNEFDNLVAKRLENNGFALDGNTLEIKYDVDMEIDSLDYDLYSSLKLLAPYGQGWEEPVFITAFKVDNVKIFNRSKTLDIITLNLIDANNIDILITYFSNGDKEFNFQKGDVIDIIYKVKYSPIFDKNISMDILDLRHSTKVINF